MASPHEYKRLDSLRGLAALSVGVGHAFLCVSFARGSVLQAGAIWIFNGDYAVDLFFVLSGFVLTNMVRGFSAAHYAAYLARRLLRLYPLLWVSLIAAYVTYAIVARYEPSCGYLTVWICRLITPPGSFVAAVKTAAPVQFGLNPVIWTIKAEIEASLVYPLMLMIWMKGGSAVKLAAAALTLSIALLFGRAFTHVVFLFMAGIALNDIRIVRERHANLAVAMGLVLMATAGMFTNRHSLPADLIAGTSAALLISSVAYGCPGWLAVVLDDRRVLRLGEISYPYYLLNGIVLWLIARMSARSLSGLLSATDDERAFLLVALLAVCAALVSILVADLANRVIEKPSIALSRAAERKILRLWVDGLSPRGTRTAQATLED